MMKRYRNQILAILLCVVLLLSFAACAQQKQSPVDATAAFLLKAIPEPAYGAVGGDWVALGLSRWGGEVPAAWFEAYDRQVREHVKECGGVLNERKYNEYSRVILALTAIGKDPTNVEGYNLVSPLADFDRTVAQGINGAMYALIALDSGNYEIPTCAEGAVQATREGYLSFILDRELPGGGWTLMGQEADIDLTAIGLQALSQYQDQREAADAIDRAIAVLSDRQDDDGGYTAYETQSSETIAQVIVALTELGIPLDDPRFVKNGHTLVDRLLDFRLKDNSFRHVMDGKTDWIATQQAFYALVAASRAQQGQTPLFDICA